MLMERTRATERDNGVDAVTRSTGHSRQEWFELLDSWGAVGRPYREIADWLTGEEGISAWWAQKLIVEYEEARGVRPPGVRRNGTFEVGASKVVAGRIEDVRAAFTDPDVRGRWLPGAPIEETERRPGLMRFEWAEGASRVTVMFERLGEAKTQVAVSHDRIRDAAVAAQAKTFWRERLEALKDLLAH